MRCCAPPRRGPSAGARSASLMQAPAGAGTEPGRVVADEQDQHHRHMAEEPVAADQVQPHVKGQRPGEEGCSPSGQEERGHEPQLEDHRPDRKQHREGVLSANQMPRGMSRPRRVLQGAALQGVAVHPAQPAEYQLRGAGGEIHQREEQVRQRERPAREGGHLPGRPARPPFPPRVQREILVAGRERQRHQEEREHRLGMVHVAVGEPVRHEEPGPQREQRHHHPGEEPDQRQEAEGLPRATRPR